MDYKVKLTKCQNEHHGRGVFDTWTKWAKPQAKWAQGSTGQDFSRLGRDLVDTSLRRFTRKDLRLEGGGG
jgi:hypothetical protein